MDVNCERRADIVTAKVVSHAIVLLVEVGYEKASKHLQTEGVPPELANQLLLLRFDRRKQADARSSGLGVFRSSGQFGI